MDKDAVRLPDLLLLDTFFLADKAEGSIPRLISKECAVIAAFRPLSLSASELIPRFFYKDFL
ncbi:Uncharacterized protein dnm_001840 [Desulfonema magnum]|uniref:Uncharacterized protein n=1 Tax=Desulfonema magnum TaxID=45655 RepID=A0A975BFM3_9BACT|nr:Uncharacterized protein dnm_001840 [Desulfonema magnum]